MWPAREIFDISLLLGKQDATYPGDPPYQRQLLARLEQGDPCELAALTLCAHAGAHLDFPAHYLPGGNRQDDYPAASFILPAVVVEAPDAPTRALGPEVLHGLESLPGAALLFKTANSRQGLASSGQYDPDYLHLSPELARACLALKPALVGIDCLSVDGPQAPGYPVHHMLLGAGVLILEGINLAQPPAGAYTLVCLPLRLAGAEAAPVRALLLR